MRSIIIIIFSIGLYTCRAPIVFKEIQPAGIPNALRFPKDLETTYFSANKDSATIDTEFVTIRTDGIELSKIFTGVIYLKDTATMRDMDFHKDSVYMRMGDLRLPSSCRFENDSARIRFRWDRPLFSFTDTSFLRIYEGWYFLNYKSAKGYYTDILWRTGDTLVHGSIADKNELSLLESSSAKGDPVILSPTRDQLIRFIQKGGFSARDKFTRLYP